MGRGFVTGLKWQKDDHTEEEKLVLAQLSRADYTYRSIDGIVEEVQANGLDESVVSRVLSQLVQDGTVYQGRSRVFGVVFALHERR